MPSEFVVHVIDDDDAVRSSIAFMLGTTGREVRTYDSAEAFLAAPAAREAGCVVTDVRMPGMTGMDLLKRMSEAGRARMPVIVITGHGDVPLAVEAMKAGAQDFIEKPFAEERLLAAIDACAQSISADTDRDDARGAARQRIASLSGRERDVLRGLVAGQPNKIIAYELGISPRTVEIYRANVMTKMQAGSLSELVRMAMRAEE